MARGRSSGHKRVISRHAAGTLVLPSVALPDPCIIGTAAHTGPLAKDLYATAPAAAAAAAAAPAQGVQEQPPAAAAHGPSSSPVKRAPRESGFDKQGAAPVQVHPADATTAVGVNFAAAAQGESAGS